MAPCWAALLVPSSLFPSPSTIPCLRVSRVEWQEGNEGCGRKSQPRLLLPIPQALTTGGTLLRPSVLLCAPLKPSCALPCCWLKGDLPLALQHPLPSFSLPSLLLLVHIRSQRMEGKTVGVGGWGVELGRKPCKRGYSQLVVLYREGEGHHRQQGQQNHQQP